MLFKASILAHCFSFMACSFIVVESDDSYLPPNHQKLSAINLMNSLYTNIHHTTVTSNVCFESYTFLGRRWISCYGSTNPRFDSFDYMGPFNTFGLIRVWLTSQIPLQ